MVAFELKIVTADRIGLDDLSRAVSDLAVPRLAAANLFLVSAAEGKKDIIFTRFHKTKLSNLAKAAYQRPFVRFP